MRHRQLLHRLRVFVPLCAVVFLLLTSSARAAGAAEKPNIVLLFIDDWAWNGSPIAMDDSMPNSRPHPETESGLRPHRLQEHQGTRETNSVGAV